MTMSKALLKEMSFMSERMNSIPSGNRSPGRGDHLLADIDAGAPDAGFRKQTEVLARAAAQVEKRGAFRPARSPDMNEASCPMSR